MANKFFYILNNFITSKSNKERMVFFIGTRTRVVCGVVALGAEVICGRVPGLTPRQREMCRAAPDAMVAVGDGMKLATAECQYQFRHQRWNCSGIRNENTFGHVVVVGSKEASFAYAITTAGVAYYVTAACARGNISACGCAPGPKYRSEPAGTSGWKWGGCSVDVGYGMRLARRFLDAREIEGDERSLMNLHNNKAGRKAVKSNLLTDCKCHGVSGSCTMKTCWKTLPTFRQIGDSLMKKYQRAKPIVAIPSVPRQKSAGAAKRPPKLRLILKKPRSNKKQSPKNSELVYLQNSPNYCEKDLTTGSLGTQGRSCNRTSKETDGCDLMCCGRGYNTHQYVHTYPCNCKFRWCCDVDCDKCSERLEEYTCK